VRATRVGVLALQGDATPHLETFESLGVAADLVRDHDGLDGLTHLVLPGGESTTLHHLLRLFDLWEPIRARHAAGELALFGTCAGAILLGRSLDERPPTWGLLDAEVERNAYGRQVDSFKRRIRLDAFARELECVFIRAPKFRRIGPGVRVLARDGREPILLTAPGLLASTFHPELSGDPLIHRHFLSPALWSASHEEVAAS
jgi:5'-phosphate synthase pdxT subunit